MHYVVHGRCHGERHGICQDTPYFSVAETYARDWHKLDRFDEIRLEKFANSDDAQKFMQSRERPYNADW